MEQLWSIAGPIAILALVGLTKLHSGRRPLSNLGLAFKKSPRLAGCLLLVMSASAWHFGTRSRIPGYRLNIELFAPALSVMCGMCGLLCLLLGTTSQKFVNLHPSFCESTRLQSTTMWVITVISVAVGLAVGFDWIR